MPAFDPVEEWGWRWGYRVALLVWLAGFGGLLAYFVVDLIVGLLP
jgi:hypothetical protein